MARFSTIPRANKFPRYERTDIRIPQRLGRYYIARSTPTPRNIPSYIKFDELVKYEQRGSRVLRPGINIRVLPSEPIPIVVPRFILDYLSLLGIGPVPG